MKLGYPANNFWLPELSRNFFLFVTGTFREDVFGWPMIYQDDLCCVNVMLVLGLWNVLLTFVMSEP